MQDLNLQQINFQIHEQQVQHCERQILLKQLKGFSYWLFLFGL